MKYGRGILIKSNGEVCEGYWENDFLTREARCYNYDGMHTG